MKPPPCKLGMQFRCPAVLVGRLHCYKASRFYLFSPWLAPDPCPLCYTAVGPYSNTSSAPQVWEELEFEDLPKQASKRCRNMNSTWLRSPCLISLIAAARAHATWICAKNFTFMSSSCKGLSKGAKCRLESRTLRTFLPMKVIAITLGTCMPFHLLKNISKII